MKKKLLPKIALGLSLAIPFVAEARIIRKLFTLGITATTSALYAEYWLIKNPAYYQRVHMATAEYAPDQDALWNFIKRSNDVQEFKKLTQHIEGQLYFQNLSWFQRLEYLFVTKLFNAKNSTRTTNWYQFLFGVKQSHEDTRDNTPDNKH